MVISIFKFDPWGQFQGQNIGQKVIIPKFTQIKNGVRFKFLAFSPFQRYFTFPDWTTSSKDKGL